MRALLAAALFAGALPGSADRSAPQAAVDQPEDAEMSAIFADDQAARAHPAAVNWNEVPPADRARRRTQALLDTGQLNSAADFYHAAYVFQHGDEAEDCLKAHALAVVAAARGKREATWIAAATLDRYLQRIGQPQIYGTQFLRRLGEKWTQEPYRRDVLSDAIRRATGVPAIANQEEQRRNWERELT